MTERLREINWPGLYEWNEYNYTNLLKQLLILSEIIVLSIFLEPFYPVWRRLSFTCIWIGLRSHDTKPAVLRMRSSLSASGKNN